MKRSADSGASDTGPKRPKSDDSKVLHVRGLPTYTTEAELVAVAGAYGQVVKTLILPDKNQAFVQMSTVEQARELLNSCEYTQPSIRSKSIFFQYSNRTEIETKQSSTGEATATLLLSITNVSVPITLENIHQICMPYGEVLKIVTFMKGIDFQALVQMGTIEQAVNAKMFLDGKDMFQGCCHIRIGYSNRQNLTVKTNNEKSRDFTINGGLPMGGSPMAPMVGGSLMGQGQGMMGMGGMGGYDMGMGQGGGGSVVLVNKLDEAQVTPDTLFILFGVYGDVLRVKILFNKRDTAMIQFNSPQQAQLACRNLNGCPLFGQNIVVTMSKHQDVKVPRSDNEEGKQLTKDFTESPFHRFKGQPAPGKNVNPPSQVLHLANIHESATGPMLRELFAAQQSGQTPVVEFFKTNRRQGYVAMSTVDDAVNALISLHGYQIGTYPLRVSFSPKTPETLVDSTD